MFGVKDRYLSGGAYMFDTDRTTRGRNGMLKQWEMERTCDFRYTYLIVTERNVNKGSGQRFLEKEGFEQRKLASWKNAIKASTGGVTENKKKSSISLG